MLQLGVHGFQKYVVGTQQCTGQERMATRWNMLLLGAI